MKYDLSGDFVYKILLYVNEEERRLLYQVFFKKYSDKIRDSAIITIFGLYDSHKEDIGFMVKEEDVLVQLINLFDDKGDDVELLLQSTLVDLVKPLIDAEE